MASEGSSNPPPDEGVVRTTEAWHKDERNWAMLCHLSAFAGYLVVIPFAAIIGPLVVWLLKRHVSSFVDENGKESVNFQITVSIAYLVIVLFITWLVAIVMLSILGIWNIVFVILASIKASNGEQFRYPLTLRLVK
jgi:uncharacterized Tic20 family protein